MAKQGVYVARNQLIVDYLGLLKETMDEIADLPASDAAHDADDILPAIHHYGFNSIGDWEWAWACIDLIDDTALAITNFTEFGLEGPTRYLNQGESYLRLYGFLNSVFLQQEALAQFSELFGVQDRSTSKIQWSQLPITRLRHILSAHTVHYQRHPASKNPDVLYYFVTRATLSGTRVQYMNPREEEYDEVDLLEVLSDHDDLALNILHNCILRIAALSETICPTLFDQLTIDLEDLAGQRQGDLIVVNTSQCKVRVRIHRED